MSVLTKLYYYHYLLYGQDYCKNFELLKAGRGFPAPIPVCYCCLMGKKWLVLCFHTWIDFRLNKCIFLYLYLSLFVIYTLNVFLISKTMCSLFLSFSLSLPTPFNSHFLKHFNITFAVSECVRMSKFWRVDFESEHISFCCWAASTSFLMCRGLGSVRFRIGVTGKLGGVCVTALWEGHHQYLRL